LGGLQAEILIYHLQGRPEIKRKMEMQKVIKHKNLGPKDAVNKKL
jgi:hypothetical protein